MEDEEHLGEGLEQEQQGAEGPGADDEHGEAEHGEGEHAEDEAGESEGEGESLADSSEEEEDEGNEYEEDGFIVEGDEEEEGDEDDEGVVKKKRKKKSRKRRKDLELDEDDYDLLEEGGIRVKRPTGRKRLKRVEEGPGRPGDQNAQQLRDELFGDEDLEDDLYDDEGGMGGAAPRRRGPGSGARGGPGGRDMHAGQPEDGYQDGYQDDLDDDEMGDFIVDEAPDGGRRRRRGLAGVIPGISAAALEEAADIFGDVDQLLDLYADAAKRPDDEEGMEQQPEEEEIVDDEDEEAAWRRQAAKEEAARRAVLRKAQRLLDPETLIAQYMMPEDQVIREKDLPERFQLLGVVQDEQTPLDLDACASWIYWLLFIAREHEGRCLHHISRIIEKGIMEVDNQQPPAPTEDGWPCDMLMGPQRSGRFLALGSRRAIRRERDSRDREDWRYNNAAQDKLREAIKQALVQMYEKGEEPALLGLYRKELIGELGAMRDDDVPLVTTQGDIEDRMAQLHDQDRVEAFPLQTVMPKHRRIRRFDALYAIMWLSLRYKKLSKRRSQLATKLQAISDSLRAQNGQAGEQDAYALEVLHEWLGEHCAELQLDDFDNALRGIQDWYSLELDMAALNLDPSQATQRAGKRAGRAGAGGVGAANAALFKRMHAAGIVQVMREALLSAAQVAENLQDPDSVPHTADEPEGLHNNTPLAWLDAKFQELPLSTHGLALATDDLIRRVKLFAVHELASEPRVKMHLRKYFDEHAVVNTAPTLAGMDNPLMEPYAKYGRVKYYRNKPLDTFYKTDSFLRVIEAARERLITYTLELRPGKEKDLMAHMERMYKSVNTSLSAQNWNAFREEIIKDALQSRLLPAMVQETRQRLLVAAKEVALDNYASAVWKLASTAPLRPRLPEDEKGYELYLDKPRIMAVCWGHGDNQSTVAVALNEHGGLVDLLHCGQLSGMIQRSRGPNIPMQGGPPNTSSGSALYDPRKQKDLARIKEKIMERRPHAVVVGMSDVNAGQLMSDLSAVLDNLLDEHAKFIQELETVNIELLPADERLAALWQDSKAAKDEFPEQPPHVRRAIALGRLQLNPLPLLASLCGPRQEVLSLNLTDMQNSLQEADRMRAVEQAMVTTTAQVGVDVNLVANVNWQKHLLQFVPGLGPRKAQALLAAVGRNNNKVESRNFMYKDMGDVLGRTVFRNCGAVLRLTSAGLPHLSNLELRQLDDSRIHPESYRLAVALCVTATGEEDVESAVENDKDKIEAVDLVELAKQKEALRKFSTLIDVQLELLAPYGELRPPSRPLTEKECFLLQHGETENSLCAGRLVEARVVYIGRDELKVRLTHCAIDGIIPREHLSSNIAWLQGDLREKFEKDQILPCRILCINEHYQKPGSDQKQIVVELSSRKDDMDPQKWESIYCIEEADEEYYVAPTEQEKAEARKKEVAAAREGTPTRGGAPPTPQRTPNREVPKDNKELLAQRRIQHPLYQHKTTKEATAMLYDDAQATGTCIFRPSTRPFGLHMSLKVYKAADGTPHILHYKIHETPPKGSKTTGQLSTPIRVDMIHAGVPLEPPPGTKYPYEYEDLDELHASFVEPLLATIAMLAGHRKFRDAPKDMIDNQLRNEWMASQGRGNVPYALGMWDAPKGGLLFFISIAAASQSTTVKVHHDYFFPAPNGWWFRKTLYTDIEKMLMAFKAQPVSNERKQQADNLGYSAPTSIPLGMAPQPWQQDRQMPPGGGYPSQQYNGRGGAGGYNDGYDGRGGGYDGRGPYQGGGGGYGDVYGGGRGGGGWQGQGYDGAPQQQGYGNMLPPPPRGFSAQQPAPVPGGYQQPGRASRWS